MRWKNFTLVISVIAFSISCGSALASVDIIDIPTSTTISKGIYNLNLRIYNEGGVLFRGWVGFSPAFMLGGSLNLEGIIGENKISGREPKILARWRFIDEDSLIPSFAMGYEPQEYGKFNNERGVYSTEPIGLYVVASRSVDFLKGMHYHIGAGNKNVFKDFNIREHVNIFTGTDISLSKECIFLMEYNDMFHSKNMSLNFGVRFAFTQELTLEIDLKNSGENLGEHNRLFRIDYTNSF